MVSSESVVKSKLHTTNTQTELIYLEGLVILGNTDQNPSEEKLWNKESFTVILIRNMVKQTDRTCLPEKHCREKMLWLLLTIANNQ